MNFKDILKAVTIIMKVLHIFKKGAKNATNKNEPTGE